MLAFLLKKEDAKGLMFSHYKIKNKLLFGLVRKIRTKIHYYALRLLSLSFKYLTIAYNRPFYTMLPNPTFRITT